MFHISENDLPRMGGAVGGGSVVGEVVFHGRLFRLRGYGVQPKQLQGVKRGAVRGFSYQARMRMIEFTLKHEVGDVSDFWTFTVHSVPTRDVWAVAKEWVLSSLVRLGGRLLWRAENQKRGAPHLHVLSRPLSPLAQLKIVRGWHAELGQSLDGDALRYGVQVVRVYGGDGVVRYVSKYVAKVGDGEAGDYMLGRCWGWRGNWRDHELPCLVWPLSAGEFVKWSEHLDGVMLERGFEKKPDKALPRRLFAPLPADTYGRLCSLISGVKCL